MADPDTALPTAAAGPLDVAADVAPLMSGTDIGLTALGIFCLLLMSGFFSGSETALTATSKARMIQFEKEGRKVAHTVSTLIDHRERLIGAILLGNNLVNIMASALATSLFISLLGESGVVVATGVMTLLVLVFAEVLPKTWAITNADRAAMVVAPIVRVVVAALAPIVAAVQFIVRLTLRLFGLHVEGDALSAHEEIRGTIDMHHKEQALGGEDKYMLGGVLDLRDLTIDEVMIHRKNMEMIDLDQPSDLIIDAVIKSSYTRIPVWQEDPENIIGILHARDLLSELRKHRGDVASLDVKALLNEPWFVPETTLLQDQLKAFLNEKRHFALVVDEYGALMGLVTLEDILEEIVGDILDERDSNMLGVRPQSNGMVNVDGFVTIRDLNRALDWNLPDDEANTIAGLVIHEAQTIPNVGQVFSYYGYRFEILRRHKNQITALRITPPEIAEQQTDETVRIESS